VLCVARPGASPAELIRVCLAKCATPLAVRFIRYDPAGNKQEFFHMARAQAQAEVRPDAVADDFGREAVVLTGVRA
jgi:hypothetical protein